MNDGDDDGDGGGGGEARRRRTSASGPVGLSMPSRWPTRSSHRRWLCPPSRITTDSGGSTCSAGRNDETKTMKLD